MKKIIFTIALFVVSNCLLASEDVIIKYYTKTEFKSLDSNKRKNIQTDFKEIKLYNSAIDGEWGAGVKKAFDTIKARLAFMNKDTNKVYDHSDYLKKLSDLEKGSKNDPIDQENSKNKKDNNNSLKIVIVLLLVLNLIYLIFKQKIDSIVKNLINNYIVPQNKLVERKLLNGEIDNKIEKNIDSDKNYKNIEQDSLMSKYESLKSENESLKSKVKNLELKIQNLESNAVIVKSEEKETEIQFKNEHQSILVKEKIIYVSDLVEGLFTRVTDIKNTNSFYIIKHMENSDLGSFDIIDDIYVKNLALSQVAQFIYPLFETKNILGSFRNFRTKPGKAKLENGKWRIIEKGTVEFY